MPNRLVFFMASFLILTSVIILMTSQGSSGAGRRPNACAVCKHRRRRCQQNCIFRPYFPADRYEEFLNVHRLFGVRAIKNKLETVSQDERDDAMKSMIFESNMRSQFPVYGCFQIFHDIQNRIALLVAEIHRIRTLISTFASASNPAAAAFFNPAATFFDPSAAVVESFSSEFRNPSRNLTVNSDDFTRFPINDDTVEFFNGGGHYGNFPYGECVTETRPLERANNSAQQYWVFPDSNNPGLSPAPENDFHSGAAVQAFMQSGGTPRNNDNRNQPNYDNRIPPNQLQLEDLLNDDEPSFSQTDDDKRYVFRYSSRISLGFEW